MGKKLFEGYTTVSEDMTRDEWEQRFAARLVEAAGFEPAQAAEIARAAGDENLTYNGDLWLDPEDDADVEISYMADG